MVYDLEKKVVCTGHGLRSLFPPTRQPPSSPVAVTSHSVCTQVFPPQTRSCRPRVLYPDYLFLSLILQRRSGFTILVGVGEDAVQCYFREHFFTLLAYIAFPRPQNRRFSHSQTLRFTPIVLALVLSFASDTRYSLNDVLETLPGYLALLLHILSTGASEHLRSMLAPSVGAKYASVFNTVGAATFSLIVYVAREILVSILRSSSACYRSHVSQL